MTEWITSLGGGYSVAVTRHAGASFDGAAWLMVCEPDDVDGAEAHVPLSAVDALRLARDLIEVAALLDPASAAAMVRQAAAKAWGAGHLPATPALAAALVRGRG